MKTILITGASSDIGMAYIQRLEETCKPGEAHIIAHYRTMSAQLTKLISSARSTRINALHADLSIPGDTDKLIESINDKYEAPTHILHLAAGKFHHMRLKQFDISLAGREMQIQVFSLAQILKAFLPVMAKNKYGRIAAVLTSYTTGTPPKYVADYSICKHALLGLIKAAAAEYCGKGICINGLSPSLVETKFISDIDARVAEIAAENSPQGRNINISEVVAGIEFLLSDENSYMCAANLNLSGG